VFHTPNVFDHLIGSFSNLFSLFLLSVSLILTNRSISQLLLFNILSADNEEFKK